MSQSRREFMRAASAALAVAAISKRARAAGAALRDREFTDPLAASVAATALNAATDAGASYADVRVEASVWQSIEVWQRNAGGPIQYLDLFAYGVRVIAHGQWGFASGVDPSPDAVARVVRLAVGQATINAADLTHPAVLAPAPVISGSTWITPIDIDPFTVPIGEQQETLLAASSAALRVRGITSAGGSLAFSRTARTFASTEGSHTVQTLWRATPRVAAYAAPRGGDDDPDDPTWRRVPALVPCGRGYEVVRDARLTDRLVQAAEAAVEAADTKPVDVGRYDVVVSASVMASLLARTLGLATSLDRAIGTGVAGSSFAGPPRAALGALAVASKHLTVTADRSLAGGCATVGWDDEGVVPDEFPLITHGMLVDYQTTRASAPALAWWYARTGRAVRSHGCAASVGAATPRESLPNLSIRPASAAIHVGDLIADIRHGFYFDEDARGATDEQLITGQWSASSVREIRNGRLGAYVRHAALIFRTVELWQSLDAIGGAASVMPWADDDASTVRAVPGRFRNVRVVSIAQ